MANLLISLCQTQTEDTGGLICVIAGAVAQVFGLLAGTIVLTEELA